MSTTRVVHTDLDSPVGRLHLYATDSGLVRCHRRRAKFPGCVELDASAVGPAARWLETARRQIDEYFTGVRREFSVPLDLAGGGVGVVDAQILQGLAAATAYGQTVAYGALATRIGPLPLESSSSPAQRIGAAMAANPLLILLPCHRVVAASGALTGYAAGLSAKRYLLGLESGQLSLELAPDLDDRRAS